MLLDISTVEEDPGTPIAPEEYILSGDGHMSDTNGRPRTDRELMLVMFQRQETILEEIREMKENQRTAVQPADLLLLRTNIDNQLTQAAQEREAMKERLGRIEKFGWFLILSVFGMFLTALGGLVFLP